MKMENLAKYSILGLVVFMIVACVAKKDDESIMTAFYSIVSDSEATGDFRNTIIRADSLLAVIESDTSVYYLGLHSLKGMMYHELGDEENSKASFTKSLDALIKKMELLNNNDILNRAYLLCFLDRKPEAIAYIKSINFSNEQLELLGGNLPIDLIEGFEYK